MKVWVVTEEIGAYSDRYWSICAAFTSRDLAVRHADALAARPGFTGECSPGDEHSYDVVALDVWAEPAEHTVVTFNISEPCPPTAWKQPKPYRSVVVIRAGWEADLWRTEVVPYPPPSGLVRVRITAPTAEDALASYRRLEAERPVTRGSEE